MNIYYAPPSQIRNGFAELRGQEATHASKVMRAREGDMLTVVDGEGGRYEGPIKMISDGVIQIEITDSEQQPELSPQLVLGMGIIKKRDRLEFAVEKSVELGASAIALFRSERTIKENVRIDRLESIAISAMKQSLRAWLPPISLYHSLDELLDDHPDAEYLAAHEKVDVGDKRYNLQEINNEKLLLLVGPEGGFSTDEIAKFQEQDAQLISLGSNRLRTETAAVVFLSQFVSQ